MNIPGYHGAYTLQSTDLDKPFRTVGVLRDNTCRGFVCGGTGTIELETLYGGRVILSVQAGVEYHLALQRVYSQNTSATSITVLW